MVVNLTAAISGNKSNNYFLLFSVLDNTKTIYSYILILYVGNYN